MKKLIIMVLYCSFVVLDFGQTIDESFNMMDRMSSSIRGFTSKYLLGKDGSIETNFPFNVPSHNAVSVMRDFNSDSMSYIEISVNPTNLKNKALHDHVAMIEYIKYSGVDQVVTFDFDKLSVKKYIPIYIEHDSCLRCHSTPDKAPSVQLDMYGSDNGFGYNLGDLYGVKYMSVDAEAFIVKHFFIVVFIFISYFNFRYIYKIWVFPSMYLDKSTNAYNKNYYIKFCKDECRSGYVFLIDIDDFKIINDAHGHDVGDVVLKLVSMQVMSIVRKSDLLFRVGGEEFLLFVSDIGDDKAKELSINICEKIERLEIPLENKSIKVTVSVGYTKKHGKEDFDFAFKRADSALYTVKKNGKNNSMANFD
ncbi:diguanylate cyclase domain-containing protein [Vibrio scophthalmi]|uniref:diguanylate cyclase n=1 Tax=Vibrio scophthalmi TaxID=45658 RepID=UPI003EBD84B9